jgi:hypothetical protein
MKVTKVTDAVRCPCCSVVIDSANGEIMEEHALEKLDDSAWECGECGELYEDRDEAKECCK